MSSVETELSRIPVGELSWEEVRRLRVPASPRYWLHALLFALTFLSTLIVGAQLEQNFLEGAPMFSFDQSVYPLGWIWQEPSRLLLGLPFACTLLAILLAHELGHYLMCRRYGIEASLPYFLPFPSFIGTLGAFIRIRSRIASRAELFDVGVAGPIAGFVLAVPALIVGAMLSRVAPEIAHSSDVQLGLPLLFHAVAPFVGRLHPLGDVSWHPVAVAAWVGIFATALNLLPGGQLDGGHILYAVWPRAHKLASCGLIVALLLMSPFLWAGWLVWSGMLLGFGRRHPYVPQSPGLGRGRQIVAGFALVMFALCFTSEPLPGFALNLRDVLDYLHAWLSRI